MDKLLIGIGAVILISAIIWWFFGKHKKSENSAAVAEGKRVAEVTVNGGYIPNVVTLQQGVPAEIVFTRKDPSGCLSHVVFPDFGVNDELPMNEKHVVSIDTSKAGEYTYACGMNMFHGKIIIK